MKGVRDALMRLSGVKSVTVKLQDGIVQAETDPSLPVVPSLIWKEIARVGFIPVSMEVWANGLLAEQHFLIGNARWPLIKPGLAVKRPRLVLLKVPDGSEDPPRVEVVE